MNYHDGEILRCVRIEQAGGGGFSGLSESMGPEIYRPACDADCPGPEGTGEPELSFTIPFIRRTVSFGEVERCPKGIPSFSAGIEQVSNLNSAE